MILLGVNRVTKHFGPEPVLDGVSFDVRPGQRIGLVGPNGVGKTTLLNLLTGKLEPDDGDIAVHRSVRVRYLEQHAAAIEGRTLWDEAYSALEELVALAKEAERVAEALASATNETDRDRLGVQFDRLQHELTHRDAYHLDHKVERVLAGLQFGPEIYERPLEKLSGGERNRLMLAKLLLADPDLMLLDEPSNHLDLEATQWLENHLASSDAAMLVVSHDRYLLDKVTTHTLELFHGTVEMYTGNFSAYWKQKDERLKVATRSYERQQEMIAKTEDFIRRNHYGQKHSQAEDRKKKLARVERVDPPREIPLPPMRFHAASRTGDLVLRVEDLAKGYDRPLFADLSFDVARGERWGILGGNGTGKTTLLRCVVGREMSDAGNIALGTGARIGYYDQLLEGLPPEETVVEAVRPDKGSYTEQERRDLLARFGVQGDMAFQTVGSLSGGERSRVALARLAAADHNFLVLDEPTNHLDLWAREALERALRDFTGTVLFVSHDRYFLNRVADHLLVVEPDRIRVVEGNYDEYLNLQRTHGDNRPPAAAADKAAKPKGSPQSAKSREETKPKRRFPYRKVADLESEIFDHESKLESLQAELTEPDVLRDGDKVRAIQADIETVKAALTQLYAHWEEATELN